LENNVDPGEQFLVDFTSVFADIDHAGDTLKMLRRDGSEQFCIEQAAIRLLEAQNWLLRYATMHGISMVDTDNLPDE
jgi:hypothetical protein